MLRSTRTHTSFLDIAETLIILGPDITVVTGIGSGAMPLLADEKERACLVIDHPSPEDLGKFVGVHECTSFVLRFVINPQVTVSPAHLIECREV